MIRTSFGRWRVILGAAILTIVPALASAHGLTGNGSWVDELICLIPALILVALVLILGRDNRKRGVSGNTPKKNTHGESP